MFSRAQDVKGWFSGWVGMRLWCGFWRITSNRCSAGAGGLANSVGRVLVMKHSRCPGRRVGWVGA